MRASLLHTSIAVSAICIAIDGHSAQITSASVDTLLTYSYGTRNNASVQTQLDVVPDVEIGVSGKTSLVASARLRLDQRDALEPGAYDYDTYTSWSRPVTLGSAGTLEIRDFFIEWRADNGVARLGKQQIVWGRLDGLKVLDLINPQDFREFIDDDLDASRISLWSAYLDYSFGDWRAELALVPDSSAHVIPEAGAWFELTAPRFRFGSQTRPAGLRPPTVEPQLSIDEAAVGLRVSRPLGRFDVSAVAYSGQDPEPLGRRVLRDGQQQAERYYARREAVGLSFDVGLGNVVLRGEYAFHPNRFFNTRTADTLAAITSNQHRAAVGIDVEAPLGVFVNAQYFFDTVSDAPQSLVRPKTDRIATLFLRRAFAYDTLALELRWYHSLTDDDRRVSMNFAYAVSDATSLEFSARYASGTPNGLFGQFAQRDMVSLRLRHTF